MGKESRFVVEIEESLLEDLRRAAGESAEHELICRGAVWSRKVHDVLSRGEKRRAALKSFDDWMVSTKGRNALEEARIASKKTYRVAGDIAGVSPSRILRHETGEQTLSAKYVIALAKCYGLALPGDYLLRRDINDALKRGQCKKLIRGEGVVKTNLELSVSEEWLKAIREAARRSGTSAPGALRALAREIVEEFKTYGKVHFSKVEFIPV